MQCLDGASELRDLLCWKDSMLRWACAPRRTLVDEKMAVKDAGEDLKQIAATLLETEQNVESRVGARTQAAAADVRDKAKEVVGEIKVRGSAQTVLLRARRC